MKKNNEEEYIDITPLKIVVNENSSEQWLNLVQSKQKFTLEKKHIKNHNLSEIDEVKFYDLKKSLNRVKLLWVKFKQSQNEISAFLMTFRDGKFKILE